MFKKCTKKNQATNSSQDSQELSPPSKKKKCNSEKRKWWSFFVEKQDERGNEFHYCKKCDKRSLPQNFKHHIEKCDLEGYKRTVSGPTGRIDTTLNNSERKRYILF